MGDMMKKVRSGERLRIPARTFNTFIDAARDFEARQRNQNQDPKRRLASSGIVPVKNASGADRERFDILGIDAPIFTPTDNEESFKNQVALKGVVPAGADHTGRFIILLEPVKTDTIVPGLVAGISPVRVDVQNEDHRFADVGDEVAGHLVSAASGAAEILWKESGTGVKWAVVRLGPCASEVLWAKAQDNWESNSGDPRIWCKRCADRQGAGETGDPFWVYLPASGGQDPNVRAGEVIPYTFVRNQTTGEDEAVCLLDTGDGVVGKSIALWMGDPANLATERPGWSILTTIGSSDVQDRVPVNIGGGKAVGDVGGEWSHIHEQGAVWDNVKAGTGTTKYFVAGLNLMSGPKKLVGCEYQDVDPVPWFAVAFIYRSD